MSEAVEHYETTAIRLEAHCNSMESMMKPPVLSDEERADLHGCNIPVDERTKDDWWKRYSELVGYNRRKEFKSFSRDHVAVDESALYDAVMDVPMSVELQSGAMVSICPASIERVAIVEDLYFWTFKVAAFREAVKIDPGNFNDPDTLLSRLRKESLQCRRRMYNQVCAPTPAPLDNDEDFPEWIYDITGIDDRRMLDVWFEVNVKRLQNAEAVIAAKYPLKKKPDASEALAGTLHGFPFMFIGVAYRENTTPAFVARDRSIVSMIATYAAHQKEHEFNTEVAKKKAAAESTRKAAMGR